jgi:hypothetical protein
MIIIQTVTTVTLCTAYLNKSLFLSLSLTLSVSLTRTLSLAVSRSLSLALFRSLSLSLSLALALSLSLSLSFSNTHTQTHSHIHPLFLTLTLALSLFVSLFLSYIIGATYLNTYATHEGMEDSLIYTKKFLVVERCEKPVLSPAGGTFAGSVVVTLKSETAGSR